MPQEGCDVTKHTIPHSRAQQVFSSLAQSLDGLNCIAIGFCPIHKRPLDLVFAGCSGTEHWCSAKGCAVKVRYDEFDEFRSISGASK
jgi:hypothetical protein